MAEFWIDHRWYPSKAAARTAVEGVRDRYATGSEVTDPDDVALLRDLLDMHPNAAMKIGVGVAGFRVAAPMRGTGRRFELIRTDGSTEAFSYPECLTPTSLDQQVCNILRDEVADLVTAYFESRIDEGSFTSDESGVSLQRADTDVSYFRGPSFQEIAEEFAANEGGWDSIPLTRTAEHGIGRLADRDQAARWRAHWEERKVLGLLTKAENRHRPKS
ncbi:DCL family protein [Streptomyces sp. NPDC017529]|uniref:DCL family protein n=1 Tax=Streptomyces sp. NPDC017529 TaxID=3365000 RepID=UPI0037B4705A